MQNSLLKYDVSCFADDYQSARKAFLSVLQNAEHSQHLNLETFTHPLSAPDGGTLTCDVAILGDMQQANQVLVLQSSTHGVEGFAGSAIQTDCIPAFFELTQDNNSLAIVLIHAINPWGFAWLRRTDHEGIDINRNFVDFSHLPSMKADQEQFLQRLLSLETSDSTDFNHLWKNGSLDLFCDQISYGQYKSPSLIYYGGNAPTWSRQTLEKITENPIFNNAQQIVVIDLHTGLGSYGYGEVINDHVPGSPGFDWVEKIFGANARSALLGESSSAEKSGLIDYHWHRVIGERGCFVTLEFGTYELHQLLTTLFQEQAYHNKLTSENALRDLSAQPVQALKSFFLPNELSWKQQVLFRGRQVASMALQSMDI